MMLITTLLTLNRISKHNTFSLFQKSFIYIPNKQQYMLYRCYINTIRKMLTYSNDDNNNTAKFDHHKQLINELDAILHKSSNLNTTKEFDTYMDNKLSSHFCEYKLSAVIREISKSKFKLSDKHIDSITILIKQIKFTDVKSLSKMFYSLILCRGVNNSIFNLLSILTEKLQELNKPIDAQSVTSILFCLNDLTSDKIQVRQLLLTLIPHIKTCKDNFKSRSITIALYGLQGMSSNSVEVCEILHALLPHIKTCKDSFTSQGIGNVLYGLQGMSSNSVEVCEILQTMIPHIKSQSQFFKAQTYEQCFFSLAYLFSMNHSIYTILIDSLVIPLEQYLTSININNQLFVDDFYALERSLNIFQFKQQNHISDELNKSIDLTKNQIAMAIKKAYYPVIYTSHSEKQILAFIKQLLINPHHNCSNIEIYNNIYKDGFELDILIIYNNKKELNFKSINIEIDGPKHDISNKRNFIKIRDELLSNKYNIIIKRIPLLIDNIYQKSYELEAEVIEILRDLYLI